MKSKLVVLMAVSMICSSAFSQKFHIGFKGGASINQLSGKSFKDQFSFGYHVGGFVEVVIRKKFSIQPEVVFSQTNIDTSSTFSSVYQFKNLTNIRLQYLSFPILVNYKPIKMLTLQAGPQFGILMNKSSTVLQNGKSAFTTGDFSMLAGVQINISHFIIYTRYNIGLSNINDIDSKEKWKSQSIHIGVGFTL